MFKKNTTHHKPDLFSLYHHLFSKMKKKINESEEYLLYQLVYTRIREDDFAGLYLENGSHPKAPVNAMVSAIFLQHRHGWIFEELLKHMEFNFLTEVALDLSRLDELSFCPISLFNFLNRLNDHFIQSGENLLEKVFDHLTVQQLRELKIKTTNQWTDSFLVASQIRNYSRLQLLIELVLRIWRVLSEEDKVHFREYFADYLGKGSGQSIYRLTAEDLLHEFDKIAQMYNLLDPMVKPFYSEMEIFRTFERVLGKHFTRLEYRIHLKNTEEINSGFVQSPDDLEATYHCKNQKESQGQSINIVETAHPENTVNLIVDVSVHPINIDDSKILEERLDRLTEKTPDVDELHFDGAYGSKPVDQNLEAMEIKGVQTAVRDNHNKVEIRIEQTSASKYQISCPNQRASSRPARRSHKAQYDLILCKHCPMSQECPPQTGSRYRTYYFGHRDFLSKRRQDDIRQLSEDRHKLRANIEVMDREFTYRMRQGKLKRKIRPLTEVRGLLKTSIFAFRTAAMINFWRIYQYLQTNKEIILVIAKKSYNYVKGHFRSLFIEFQHLFKKISINPIFQIRQAINMSHLKTQG